MSFNVQGVINPSTIASWSCAIILSWRLADRFGLVGAAAAVLEVWKLGGIYLMIESRNLSQMQVAPHDGWYHICKLLPRELATLKGLTELPKGVGYTIGDNRLAVTGGCHEGERLSIQNIALVLPILAPVLLHWHPGPVCSFCHHWHLLHVPGSSHVCDQHQQEPRVAIDGEAQSSLSLTWYPAHTMLQPL